MYLKSVLKIKIFYSPIFNEMRRGVTTLKDKLQNSGKSLIFNINDTHGIYVKKFS